jgi:hypothetical protein
VALTRRTTDRVAPADSHYLVGFLKAGGLEVFDFGRARRSPVGLRKGTGVRASRDQLALSHMPRSITVVRDAGSSRPLCEMRSCSCLAA